MKTFLTKLRIILMGKVLSICIVAFVLSFHGSAFPCGQNLANYDMVPNPSFTNFLARYLPGQIAPTVYLQPNCQELNAQATLDMQEMPAIIITKRLADFLYVNAVWTSSSWVNYVRDVSNGNIIGNQVVRPEPEMQQTMDGLTSIWKAYLTNSDPPVQTPSVAPEDEAAYVTMRDGIFTGEMAFLLGHEMGHWIHGDMKPDLRQTLKGIPIIGQVYSRFQESEADKIGEAFVFALFNNSPYRLDQRDKTHWFPVGMSLFVLFMENTEFIESSRGNVLPQFLSTHPHWDTRWKNICQDGLSQSGWPPDAASIKCAQIQQQFHNNVAVAWHLIQQQNLSRVTVSEESQQNNVPPSLFLCESYLKDVATGLEMYAQDHEGSYPEELATLVPNYMRIIPKDPATGQDFIYSLDENSAGYELSASDPSVYNLKALYFTPRSNVVAEK